MTAALSVAPGLAGAELGEYRVGYISQDGMRHQVSLADAQAVRFDARAERVSRVLLVWRGQRRLRAVSIDGATSDVPVSASCRSPHWKALASAATKGRRWRAPSSGLKLMSAAVVGYSGFPLQFLGVLQDL